MLLFDSSTLFESSLFLCLRLLPQLMLTVLESKAMLRMSQIHNGESASRRNIHFTVPPLCWLPEAEPNFVLMQVLGIIYFEWHPIM